MQSFLIVPNVVPVKTNGAAIKELRVACGWRQVRFAKAIQISPAYLSNIEAGRRQASPEVRVRIAEVLGVPLGAIVDGVPDLSCRKVSA